jgi:hypothetical protein
LTLDE